MTRPLQTPTRRTPPNPSDQRESTTRFLTMEDLSELPFLCVNCFKPVDLPNAYCTQLCTDQAGWVRYTRPRYLDGRAGHEDIAQAIRIKLAHILGGGYNKKRRRVSRELRQAVIDREGGRCRICGSPGSELDHIHGGSSDLSNLQWLCDSCHNKKTVAMFVRISKESHPEEWALHQSLWKRVKAAEPIQLCDVDGWQSLQPELLRRREGLAPGFTRSLF
jgi:HNH endonuclease